MLYGHRSRGLLVLRPTSSSQRNRSEPDLLFLKTSETRLKEHNSSMTTMALLLSTTKWLHPHRQYYPSSEAPISLKPQTTITTCHSVLGCLQMTPSQLTSHVYESSL